MVLKPQAETKTLFNSLSKFNLQQKNWKVGELWVVINIIFTLFLRKGFTKSYVKIDYLHL